MTGWLALMAVAVEWIMICSGGVFLLTLLALAVYTWRKGVPDASEVKPTMRPFGAHSPSGQTGVTRYRGRAKLKVLFSRRTEFLPMDSLVNGTATREEWAVVIGAQVAFVTFWLIFLGAGLMLVPGTNGLSLFLPVVVGLWLYGIFSAQWTDFKRARRKKAPSGKKLLREINRPEVFSLFALPFG